MNESSKTNAIRGNEFFQLYLNGKVLDIGAGLDPVCKDAIIFDQQHGDANFIQNYFTAGSFDTVHSSHCLEHMIDPMTSLEGWWSLVKPGGYMITVVPHEDLYEQGIWPSFFNDDHKSTFRIDKPNSWSPASFDIAELHLSLPASVMISTEIHSHNLITDLLFKGFRKPRKIKQPWKLLMSILKRTTNTQNKIRIKYIKWLVGNGYPFDQTAGDALAQIQVIIQKKVDSSI